MGLNTVALVNLIGDGKNMRGDFTVRQLPDGRYQVTGSSPGWGAANNRKSDQVRRVVHDAVEAETVRAELQAQRDLALRKRVRARGDQRLRTVETTLSRDEQRSAEAAAQLIRERADPRTILQLVEEGLRIRAVKPRPLSVIVDEFLKTKEPPVLSERGFKSLSATVRMFVREVRDEPSVDEVTEWMNVPPSRDGRKNRRAYAAQFLRWAVELGYCRANPTDQIPVPKHAADADITPTVLTPVEAKRLLRAARQISGGRFQAYTALSLFAGFRPSELTRLNRAHLPTQISNGEIPVRSKVRESGGQRKKRLVPVEPALRRALRGVDWTIQELDVHASLPRQSWAAVRGAARLLETWPPDCLRHSYCSYRVARGDKIGDVARNSGNSEAVLVKFYGHPQSPEAARKFFAI